MLPGAAKQNNFTQLALSAYSDPIPLSVNDTFQHVHQILAELWLHIHNPVSQSTNRSANQSTDVIHN